MSDAAPALTFTPLDEAGLAVYASWFVDEELQRRMEFPTAAWLDFVRRTPGYYAWMVSAGGDMIGYIGLEIEADGLAHVGLAVRPAVRACGYGRTILRALLARPELAEVRAVEAGIAAYNMASLRCFAAAGFVADGHPPDEDGFLHLIYTR